MKYAIIESGGKQFKAVEGGLIDVDRLPVEAGANVKLEQVLLLADGENVTIGTPIIKGETVWAKALAHVKGPKLETFNYRPKKRIRVKIGHRQNYTRLLIQQIGGSELVVKEEPKVEKPAKKAEPKAEPKAKAAAKPASSPKGKAEKKATPATSSPKGKAASKEKAAPKAKTPATSSPKGKPASKATKKTSEKKSE